MSRAGMMEDAPFFPQVAEGPSNVSAYWIITEDKVRLRVAHWPTEETSKGTVFVFQGRTENIEKMGAPLMSYIRLDTLRLQLIGAAKGFLIGSQMIEW